MARSRTPNHGEGTAWLLEDDTRHDYICSWYAGRNDAHLGEHARVATLGDALAWGRGRTTRVRIRTSAARTYWAGSARLPDGFMHTWPEATTEAQALERVTC